MIVAEEPNTAKFSIQAFAPGKVKVNNIWHTQSIFVQAEECEFLDCKTLEEFITRDWGSHLQSSPAIVLLGTGPTLKIPPEPVRAFFLTRGIGFEFMDSYAVCRTYAVLQSEMRSVALYLLIE